MFRNYLRLLATTAAITLLFTLLASQSPYHTGWADSISPAQKDITTERNLKRRNLITEEWEERKKDFDTKQDGLTLENPISDFRTSFNLRVVQYEEMLKELHKYFFVGNIFKIAYKAFGFNPHNSILDFISRLGLLYFIGIIYLYRVQFFKLNIVFVNLCILPILVYQPFGYTLGHGFLVFMFYYCLISVKKEALQWKSFNCTRT